MDKELGLTLHLVLSPRWKVSFDLHASPWIDSKSTSANHLFNHIDFVSFNCIHLKQATIICSGTNHCILLLLEILPGVIAFKMSYENLDLKLFIVSLFSSFQSNGLKAGIGKSSNSPYKHVLDGALYSAKKTNRFFFEKWWCFIRVHNI